MPPEITPPSPIASAEDDRTLAEDEPAFPEPLRSNEPGGVIAGPSAGTMGDAAPDRLEPGCAIEDAAVMNAAPFAGPPEDAAIADAALIETFASALARAAWDDCRALLMTHPALLTDAAATRLDARFANPHSGADPIDAEAALDLLRRAREIGVDQAFEEALGVVAGSHKALAGILVLTHAARAETARGGAGAVALDRPITAAAEGGDAVRRGGDPRSGRELLAQAARSPGAPAAVFAASAGLTAAGASPKPVEPEDAERRSGRAAPLLVFEPGLAPDGAPFADPAHWAAFSLYGE